MDKETRKSILGNETGPMEEALSGPQRELLKQLVLRYQESTAAKQAVREQAGRTSREIGIARSRGEDIEPLKTDMQRHSRELATLDSKLVETEQQIDTLLSAPQQDREPADTLPADHEPQRYRRNPADIGQVSVSLLEKATDAWNAYVGNHPCGTLYHRAEWRTLFADTFGHNSYYCVAQDRQNRIVGVLPLTRLTSRLFGDFMISVPYFNYGGPLGDSAAIESALIEYAASLADQLGISHIELRDEVPRAGMPARTGKVNMLLPLPADHQALWNGFTSKLRAQIRRAQRENPTIHIGGKELLNDFYRVFSCNMRDLGTPVYGRNFFRNFLDTFPEQSRIAVVRLGNRPVAAGFLAAWESGMEIPWASTVREVNHLGINMFLYWEVLRYAIGQGSRQFDFGRSSVDSGTFRFKQQWGARPKQLYWHYWLADGRELPELNPSNPRYAMVIGIWKRLPVCVTRWIGPAIVKYLP